jgi:hypothetical protein
MTKSDQIELLENAQMKINEAIELIEEAVSGTDNQMSVDAYLVAHLDNWANGGNPYDQTIPVLIEEMEQEEN